MGNFSVVNGEAGSAGALIAGLDYDAFMTRSLNCPKEQ
jgi:hypothetical protein